MKVATVMCNNIKTDYYVVNDSDASVEEGNHKRAQISDLANSNGGLYGSEHINEEVDQTTEFDVENYCDASFDYTPYKKACLSAQVDYNWHSMPEGINILWC